MTIYQLSEEASLDFFIAYDYLEARSERAAARWEREMLRAFDHLAAWPYTGHVREDITSISVRFWPVDRYLVVYDPEVEPVAIVAVLHGSRDAASILNERLSGRGSARR